MAAKKDVVSQTPYVLDLGRYRTRLLRVVDLYAMRYMKGDILNSAVIELDIDEGDTYNMRAFWPERSMTHIYESCRHIVNQDLHCAIELAASQILSSTPTPSAQ